MGRYVSKIFGSFEMVVTLNRWSSLLARICLKTGQDDAEDGIRRREKVVKDEHLIKS